MAGRIYPSEDGERFKWISPSDPLIPSSAAWKAWREAHPSSAGMYLLCQVCGDKVSWFDVAPERTRASGYGPTRGAYQYRPGGQIIIVCTVKFPFLVRTAEYRGKPLDIIEIKVHQAHARVQACLGCQATAMRGGGEIDMTDAVRRVSGASRAALDGRG